MKVYIVAENYSYVETGIKFITTNKMLALQIYEIINNTETDKQIELFEKEVFE